VPAVLCGEPPWRQGRPWRPDDYGACGDQGDRGDLSDQGDLVLGRPWRLVQSCRSGRFVTLGRLGRDRRACLFALWLGLVGLDQVRLG
jgi:hypothetical protein